MTSRDDPPAQPILRLHRPLPTAAFSGRETRLPGFPAATRAARRLGFEPQVRTVGGQLAPLHEDTLLVDLIAEDANPQGGIRDRFDAVSAAVARALRGLGVPAGVGEVPGEYCPGEFSVHAAHRVKLAGIAQRVTRWGYLVSTVIVLDRTEPCAPWSRPAIANWVCRWIRPLSARSPTSSPVSTGRCRPAPSCASSVGPN